MSKTFDRSGGSSPTSEDIKEVYARFGLAYYQAEVLHRGLCNLYAAFQVPSTGPIIQPRIEEHLRTAFESTLGQLISKLKASLPATLIPSLERAAARRNFLAHYFWFERAPLFANSPGITSMINELSADTDLFTSLDAEIERLIEPSNARFGITPDYLREVSAQIALGEPFEPVNQQRKPKKEETIIAVFNVPTTSNRSSLVFQSDDGVLWQLCDVGLGWTTYETVDPSWLRAEAFACLLPAKVNPRPPVSAPWTFKLRFGTKIVSVRLGKGPGEVLYKFIR
jgi:hypothetical protein